jgi:hypothetical protein
MEENLKFMQNQIEALQSELSLKDAELLKTKEKLTEALKYVNQYVQTLEVIQSEL